MNDLDTKLEILIDAYGLGNVLSSIAGTCAEKADHIRASYGDDPLARSWNAAGVRIAEVAVGPRIKAVTP